MITGCEGAVMHSIRISVLAQLVVGTGLLTITGCEEAAPPKAGQDVTPQLSLEEHLLHAFGSKNGIAVIRNAESVQAYRLAPENSYAKSFDDYESTSDAIPLSGKLAERTKTCLLNNRHCIGGEKGCRPDYGVRLHFSHGDESIDVLLCFSCKILRVYQNSKLVGGGHFDTIEEELLDIVKQLFPDDDGIQALKSYAQWHAEDSQSTE